MVWVFRKTWHDACRMGGQKHTYMSGAHQKQKGAGRADGFFDRSARNLAAGNSNKAPVMLDKEVRGYKKVVRALLCLLAVAGCGKRKVCGQRCCFHWKCGDIRLFGQGFIPDEQ